MKEIADACGIEFSVPDGFEVFEDSEFFYDMGCIYRTADKKVIVDVFVDKYEQNIPDYMAQELYNKEAGYMVLKGISLSRRNGLEAYEAAYKNAQHGYYEVNYQSQKGYGNTHLSLLIYCRLSNCTAEELLNRPEIMELLKSVKMIAKRDENVNSKEMKT